MSALPDPRDAAEQRVVDDIRGYGWHVMVVRPLADDAWEPPSSMPDAAAAAYEPGFAYTIGLLHTLGHPELILVGDWTHAIAILNVAADLIREGTPITDGFVTGEVLEAFDVRFGAVAPAVSASCLTWATWASGIAEPPAMQIVLPDDQGRWPDDPAYDSRRQPLLGDR